jgi:hypothetical protein
MTIREQIENSEIFLSGARFRPKEMARHLGLSVGDVGNVLVCMRDTSRCAYDNGLYWLPRKHWITRAPLNDPERLYAARTESEVNA